MEKNVCPWCEGHPLLYEYHNREWGIPVHDDKKHFEFLSMEVMQCGLSWLLALKKRKAFNEAFFDFDYLRVAAFNEDDIQTALKTRNMLRSERKIRAVVNNARVFIKIREEYGSFDNGYGLLPIIKLTFTKVINTIVRLPTICPIKSAIV